MVGSNKFYSYIRVSTKDQERGASLDEQLRQIREYAKSKGFEIAREYREIQSASKVGRIQFAKMFKDIERDSDIRGVIFHTVDRSARNPFDQAKLYELKQAGYELHFAVDRTDSTNHSAMSMLFIRWGIASYFSENLKQETKKGILGRLNEGKFPGRAPFGYLDKKQAEKIGYKEVEPGVKVIDPIQGPLLRQAFEIYSTGEYTVQELNAVLVAKGLRNKGGHSLHWKMLYKVLRNPFYYGFMNHNGELFKGMHKPLVSKALFDKVQLAIEGRANKFKTSHFYLMQRLVICATCGKPMKSVTSKRKYHYFYCRRQDCGYSNSVHQEDAETLYVKELGTIAFKDQEIEGFRLEVKNIRADLFVEKEFEKKALGLEISKTENRLNGLLDKLFDNDIPTEVYQAKKNEYMNTLATLRERFTALDKTDGKIFDYLEELGKLLKDPVITYKKLGPEQKRAFIKSMVENFFWDGKNLSLVWKKPFNLVAERPLPKNGSPDGI
jgi:site-specific DNA recombinase